MVRSKYVRDRRKIVRLICARQDLNRDAMIAMSGSKGNGKSNNALTLIFEGIRLRNRVIRSGNPTFKCVRDEAEPLKWSWRKNMPYTTEELKRCSDDRDYLQNYSFILVDEAIEAIYKRDAVTRASKDIIKRFNKNRTRRIVSFWNVPDFLDLDKDMLKLFNYHIWVFWRNNEYSISLVFRRNTSGGDPWGLIDLKKHVHRLWEEMDESEAWDFVKRMKRHPNLVGVLRIRPLPEKLFDKYETIRNEGVIRRDYSIEESVGEEGKYKEWVQIILFNSRRVFARKKGDLKKLHKILCKDPKDESFIMTPGTFGSWTKKKEK